jgi:hypothetical protein
MKEWGAKKREESMRWETNSRGLTKLSVITVQTEVANLHKRNHYAILTLIDLESLLQHLIMIFYALNICA